MMKTAKRQAQTLTAMRVPEVTVGGAETGWDSDGDWDMAGGGSGRLQEGLVSGA